MPNKPNIPNPTQPFNNAANNAKTNKTTNQGQGKGIVTAAKHNELKKQLATPRRQLILSPNKATVKSVNQKQDDKARKQVTEMGNTLNSASRNLRRNFHKSSRGR